MSTSVNSIFNSVKALVNKQQMGTFKPANFNVYAKMAQQDIFNEFYVEFQNSQRISDGLRPLIQKLQLVVVTGKIQYPSNYGHLIALRSYGVLNPTACDEYGNPLVMGGKNIQIIDNDKLGNRLDSFIAPPSFAYPIATLYDTFIQVYPIEIGSCVFEHLRQPVDPFWAYVAGSNPPVYDPANSVDFEFNWQMANKLIIKICGYYGITIRENELITVANEYEKKQV